MGLEENEIEKIKSQLAEAEKRRNRKKYGLSKTELLIEKLRLWVLIGLVGLISVVVIVSIIKKLITGNIF